MVFQDNLASMQGRVRSAKPNCPKNVIRDFLNDRIRYLMDTQPYWADMFTRGILSMPAAYVTGTVALTSGSKTVTGSSTVWPVSDTSNLTIPAGVSETGVLRVTPSAMTGIATDAFLYVDGDGDPESVAVLETTATTFSARFLKRHNASCILTQSSLAGLQLKLGATYPTFTIRGVHSTTELEIDMAWGGSALSGAAYQILKSYFSIAPDLKDILNLWDPQQGRPLLFHKSQDWLNVRDPQRMATGYPQALVDFTPNESGSAQYELWPHQVIAYQIPVLYSRQWPALQNPTDRPPPFISPSILIDGATADALRRNGVALGSDVKDPWFNPQLADRFEQKFAAGVTAALNSNQGKVQSDLEEYRNWVGIGGGSGSYAQSHVSDMDW